MAISATNWERRRSRVTAELTQEPRAMNYRPILFYLIVLRVDEPFDVFERVETNERKRNNRTCTSLHQGRCQKCCGVLGHILAYLMLRHAFLSKPERRVQRPFALEVTAAAGQSSRRVYHFSLKSSSNISCTSSFF